MNRLDQKKKTTIGVIGFAIILATGWQISNSRFEDTDNAYTAAHVATLSPKVGGLITEVFVEENFKVKKDQVLARVDARDYQNALNNLKSQLGAIQASLKLAMKDYQRSSMLFAEHAISEQDRDNDATKVQELEKRRDALSAQIAQAELNLSFTEIRAPSDGTVGKKLAEPGMVVSAGQPLLSFVDSQTPWVVANFKETQLKKMRIGQKAEIVIDSIGGKVFEGEIESFAPGTGATFALIPPDNATGNFTKIVQRVPVRIRFEPQSIHGYEDRIVPGLSAEAKILLNSVAASSAQSAKTEKKLTQK
ncbi:MAG: HlyD family secretion protein [Bdellovibrionia bacterium]